jgi:uncharacterized protein
MEPLSLPQLARAFQQTEIIPVNTTLPDLETLTPIQGEIRVVHGGNYIRVESHAETIVTLTCDRCLQHYNHRLTTDASELIWLDNSAAEESLDDVWIESFEDAGLDETLPADGYFHPADWLYQQLCLDFPQRNLCSEDCPGLDVHLAEPSEGDRTDHRWAALESLKHRFS